MAIQRNHPLNWPKGQKRNLTPRHSTFKVSAEKALQSLIAEVKAMGGEDLVVSSNAQYRADGMPYARQPYFSDSGVAIYFTRKKKEMVFACDTFVALHDNIRAIALTIESVRRIERFGSLDLMERALSSFLALPPPIPMGMSKPWWEILGVDQSSPVSVIDAAFKAKASQHHPDKSGTHAAMAELNLARDAGRKEAGA